jgi:predicted membrane protein (TIGR00267 family)
MPDTERTLTRTERNLWSAILSEALAHLKYTAYANKALEEGRPEVAQVFQEVAGAETIHGINHLRVAGEVKSSLENLRAVVIGESKEFSTLYPRMIREALDEGRPDAAHTFTLAMDREQHHLESFAKALENLEREQRAPAAPPAELAERRPEPVDGRSQASQGSPPRGEEIAPVARTFPRGFQEIEGERRRLAAFGRIREVVFGAQDGLISTVALVTSVAAAVNDTTTVVVAGLAAALAGMLSMATGSYLGSKAQRDVIKAEIEKEAKELEENPGEELAELVFLYHKQGMTYGQAREMAEHIASDKELWVRTMVEKELGISPDMLQNPIKDGLTMGASFILAAIVPIVPYFFLTGTGAIAASVAAALTGLFLLGTGKGRLVQKSPLLQGLEVLFIGAAAAAVGFLLGEGIPRLLS